ncbi:hypothetical protein CJF32_00009252 [Rutstroemia sp. NJR-2017a WRK4]|nr:hypothetical protein CJF32_00009252 [Rutstroemia sp. NJR-2017a WRK4]
MLRILEKQDTKAILLADATGLGNIMEMIGFWTWLSMQRAETVSAYEEAVQARDHALQANIAWQNHQEMEGEDSDSELMVEEPLHVSKEPIKPIPAKPKLLLYLLELIDQSVDEISRFSTRFKVYPYYTSHRKSAKKQEANKTPPYLVPKEDKSDVVVVTSLITPCTRHGPASLKAWRINHKDWSSIQADADPEWEHSLAGLFDFLTVDEAHILKNEDSQSHITVSWLNVRFLIMATATVLSNSVKDFTGYIKFVEVDDTLWSAENLKKWDFKPNENPYTLPDNHPASVLQPPARALNTWTTAKMHMIRKSDSILQLFRKKL